MKTMNTVREFLWEEKTEEEPCTCEMVAHTADRPCGRPETKRGEGRMDFLQQLSRIALAGVHCL